MNSISTDALFTSSTRAVGMGGASARADAWLDAARAAAKTAALRALFVIRRSPSPALLRLSSMTRRGSASRLGVHSTPTRLVVEEDGEKMAVGTAICRNSHRLRWSVRFNCLRVKAPSFTIDFLGRREIELLLYGGW